MNAGSTDTPKIAYVGGAGRSGSTVLALLLTRFPDFVAVGGLTNLWERGLRDNFLCGCGVHFDECPFWDEVGRAAFGGWEAVDVEEILRLKLEVARYRHVPLLLVPHLRPSFLEKVTVYADYMARTYQAVAKVSGSKVIVDNSHDIPPALVLQRSTKTVANVIHLVRDSRGVAFSVSKEVQRAEATSRPTYMDRYSAGASSGIWLLANVLYDVIPARSLPRLRVHYETLVRSPATEIARILEFLDVEVSADELAILDGESIDITENHMISGNPHRLGRTQLRLRLDEEWRARMRPRDRRLVTLLTFPLALAYGYTGSRRQNGGGSQTQIAGGKYDPSAR